MSDKPEKTTDERLLEIREAEVNAPVRMAKYGAMVVIAAIAAYWAMTGIKGWGWLIFVLVLMIL